MGKGKGKQQMRRRSMPGFRFSPTDVELVEYYLKRKVLGKKFPFEAIAEVDIYEHDPCRLPDMSCLKTGDRKWYFFCQLTRKYGLGSGSIKRSISIATKSTSDGGGGGDIGYWKPTGNDKAVEYGNNNNIQKVQVGMMKTLVFHRGKAPQGERTDWVMHEYRLHDDQKKELLATSMNNNRGGIRSVIVKDLSTYVLCAVFKKDGKGPKNGSQYGALFNELDWMTSDDDDDDELEEEEEEEEDSSNWVGLDPLQQLQQQVNDYGIGAAVSSTSVLRAADDDIIMDGNYYYYYYNNNINIDNPVALPSPSPNAATLIPWVDAPEAPHHDHPPVNNPSPPPFPVVAAAADADAAVPLPLLMEVSHQVAHHHQHVEEEEEEASINNDDISSMMDIFTAEGDEVGSEALFMYDNVNIGGGLAGDHNDQQQMIMTTSTAGSDINAAHAYAYDYPYGGCGSNNNFFDDFQSCADDIHEMTACMSAFWRSEDQTYWNNVSFPFQYN